MPLSKRNIVRYLASTVDTEFNGCRGEICIADRVRFLAPFRLLDTENAD